ncbi:hypothetical protein [Sphingopyxis granuli]|uniref:Uncharacterized protein n=1 Tax=Sphingopyxis granuli TaxID=267128 RepID=A0AA86GK06_9SPHN|nr:hypothetical protein [Sphingopyxis granuli]AMG74355.1 Uncharacterized protein SGRAN_1978 [Sphingopyxis granuli]
MTVVMPRYAECPVFPDIADFALTFLFELPVRIGESGHPAAFRLESIHRAIEPEDESDSRFPAYDALVEPVRSYLDDVTNGGPGRGGRPLIFLAQPEKIEDDRRRLTLHCPAQWRYRSEGRTMEMVSACGGAKTIALRYRDAFCLFESGRLFYCFSMFPEADGSGKGVDEYTLIAMQRLAAAKPDQQVIKGWRFALDGESPVSLTDMATARLAMLAADDSATHNGLRRYLQRTLGLKPPFEVGPRAVRNLLISIEDERLLGIASFSDALQEDFALTDEAREAAAELAARRAACLAGAQPHYPAENPDELLPFLALSGVLQSVVDFPFQDPAELYDSTRPAIRGESFFNYAHPRYHIEISEDSRSMHDARLALGNCPYLTLMWLVAVHDELMVTEIEEAIDVLIYGNDEAELIAEPLRPLAQAVRAITLPWRSPIRELRRNLEARFDLFRRYSINQSSHLFRYEKEREALAAVEAGMGNRDRYERAHRMIDRIEGLVEDMHAVNGAYNSARTGRMVMFITLLGLINFYDQLTSGLVSIFRMELLGQAAFVLLLLVLLLLSFPSEVTAFPRRVWQGATRLLRPRDRAG